MRKYILIPILITIYIGTLYSQSTIKIARRMQVIIADLNTSIKGSSLIDGKVLADEFEKRLFKSGIVLEKVILVRRANKPDKLKGLSLDNILGIIERGRELGVEGMFAGEITESSNGKINIQIQLIDTQKKNIPSTRRILNYAEDNDINPTADSIALSLDKLIKNLETGQFPRVDIITPNFDVVSILQINKDNFPEIKLSVNVVNNQGDPVSIPTALFEVRENGNMVLSDIQKVKTDERVSIPITLLLAIDRSPSMLEELDGKVTGKPFERAKTAAIEFINKMSKNDKIKVIAFDYNVLEIGDYTTDKSFFNTSLSGMKTGKGTGLYNVLKYVAEDIAKVQGEKAVILLTDGKNDVRNADPEVKAVTLDMGLKSAKKNTIPVYTIGFGSADKEVLSRIAKETHSLFFKASSSEKLRELYLKIHKIIENQYVITYKSLADKFGRVNVSLNVKEDERTYTLTEDEQEKAETVRKEEKIKDELGGITLQKKEIESLQNNIELEKKRLAEAEALLNKEKLEIETRLKEIDNKDKELNTKNSELEAEKVTLNKKKVELDTLSSQLSDKETKINTLETQLKQKETKLTQDTQQLKVTKTKILEIKKNINNVNNEILQYLKQKIEYINSEEQKLNSLLKDQEMTNK